MSGEAVPVCIIGCGYTGTRVAARWLEHGVPVQALVRNPATSGLDSRIRRLRGDLNDPATLPAAAMAGTRLYYFAPPPASGIQDTRIRGLLGALATPPRKLVLISTTGVYGDCGGAWVDETRPPQPGSDRARRRLDAEQTLAAYAADHGMARVTLRVAGIYGPGRLPLKRLGDRTPLPAAEDCGYTNRVHIEDLVEACMQAMAQPATEPLINVSDGSPGTMREYLDRVADAFGYPRLPVVARAQIATTLSQRMQTYLGESRRVDNSRLLALPGMRLRYPEVSGALTAMGRETPAP